MIHLLFFVLIYSPFKYTDADPCGVVVPDSAEFKTIIRTDDLMDWAGRDYISFDRLSFSAYSPRYGYMGRQPAFFIDGIPLDADFFGITNPAHLPAAPLSYRRIYTKKNTISGREKITIITNKIEDGLAVSGAATISNEAGEPGPWVYDPARVTPNVERFGPGVDLEAVYGRNGYYGRGLFRFHRHMNSNLSIQSRMKNMLAFPAEGEWLQVEARTKSGMAEAGFRNENTHIRARALVAESDDFLFLRQLGREVPSASAMQQYSLAGDFNLSNLYVQSYLQYQEKRIGYRRNQFVHRFDWSEHSTTLHSYARYQRKGNHAGAGATFRAIDTDAPGITESLKYYGDMFTDGAYKINSSVRLAASAKVTIHEKSPGFNSHAGIEMKPTRAWKSEFSAGYESLPFQFSNPMEDLISRGFDLQLQFGIPFINVSSAGNSSLFELSTNNTFTISDRLELNAGAKIIRHRAFHIPFQPVEYNQALHTLPGTYRLYENENGSRAQLSAGMDHRPSETFHHQLQTTYSATLNGSEIYRNFWEQAPRLWILYTAEFSPYPDLDLRAQVRYRSAAHWHEFNELEGELYRSFYRQFRFSYGTFTSSPPAHLNIDLSAAKWFWHQRLRAVVMVKNLLNKDYYPHPLAVREGFTFALKAEIRL
jgi:hypothetical protein